MRPLLHDVFLEKCVCADFEKHACVCFKDLMKQSWFSEYCLVVPIWPLCQKADVEGTMPFSNLGRIDGGALRELFIVLLMSATWPEYDTENLNEIPTAPTSVAPEWGRFLNKITNVPYYQHIMTKYLKQRDRLFFKEP